MRIKWQIILLLQAIVSIVLGVILFQLNVLPFRYLLIVYGVLALLFILMYYFVKPPKRIGRHQKKSMRSRVGKIVSLVLSVLLIIASVMVAKTNGTILNIAGNTKETTVIALVVLKSNNYDRVSDLNNKKIGMNVQVSTDKINKGKEKLGTKISYEEKDYTDFQSLGNALYHGNVKGILFDYAYVSLLESFHSDFDSKTEVLWKYEITESKTNHAANKDVTKEPFTIMVSGVDSRGSVSEKSRSDVNMILTINPNTKQILFTSIPRDYYVTLSGVGEKDKLTHAGLFGTDAVEKTVENFMNIDIDYNARVGFQAVVKIVDAIGGVDVYSDKSFRPWTDHGVYIRKGTNHMNGRKALAFARERKIYSSGDRHRAANQQAVLKAILEKIESPSIIANYSSLLDAVSGTFQTNMQASDITDLAKMQLSDGGEWDVQQSILKGTDKKLKGGYMMPNSYAYYCVPSQSSIKKNRQYIKNMLAGKKISVDAEESAATA